jgi:hypothetical protein
VIAILASLALGGFVVWFCRTETPAVARHRDEDEPTGRGPGDEF